MPYCEKCNWDLDSNGHQRECVRPQEEADEHNRVVKLEDDLKASLLQNKAHRFGFERIERLLREEKPGNENVQAAWDLAKKFGDIIEKPKDEFEDRTICYRDIGNSERCQLLSGHAPPCSLFTLKRVVSSPTCVCGVEANQHGGCRNYRPNVPCPSTYTHSSLGKLTCEKDKGHLHRIGDVEHRRGQTVWMSI